MTSLYEALERHPAITGFFGSAASLSASAVTFLPQVEMALRLASLVLGVATGALTFVITWRKVFPGKSKHLEPSSAWPRH